MSVVVRMEMPLNCFECPMYDWNRQKLCCNAHLDLRPIPNGGAPKPDWCPVICELPEGHGRLVDADALDAAISDEIDESKWDNAGFTGYRVWSKVDEAPTIVPATNTPNKTPTNTPTATERSET